MVLQAPMLSRRLRVLVLLALAVLPAACDTAPSPPASVTNTPTRSEPRLQPLSQGWIFKLPALAKENHYKLDLDVLAEGGLPIGVLSMGRGRNYEKQGKPDLISTVQITANGNPVLELAAASPPGTPGDSSQVEVASQGRSYEKTTAEGWRVRTTVNALAIQEHPKLPDGSEGPSPVFTTLDMDVEVAGSTAGPYLGLTADNVSASRAALENLRGPDLQLLDHGVVVREVTPGGPAGKAGLREGDVILAINNEKIRKDSPLSVLLNRFQAGETIDLDVVRDTKPFKIAVTLGKRP